MFFDGRMGGQMMAIGGWFLVSDDKKCKTSRRCLPPINFLFTITPDFAIIPVFYFSLKRFDRHSSLLGRMPAVP